MSTVNIKRLKLSLIEEEKGKKRKEQEQEKPLIDKVKESKKIKKNEKDVISHYLRSGFIFKVYCLLLFQVIISFIMLLASFKNEKFNKCIRKNKGLFYFMLIVGFLGYCLPIMWKQIIYKKPYNYFYMFIFNLSMAYLLCKFAIGYKEFTVFLSSTMTLVTAILLVIYAFFSKKSFSIISGIFFIGFFITLLGIIFSFVYKFSIIRVIIILLCLLGFSTYIIYDTQLIISGKRLKFDINDYVPANMALYLDLIQLLIEFLQILFKLLDSDEENKQKMKSKKLPGLIETGDDMNSITEEESIEDEN